MDAAHPRKLSLWRYSGSETISVNYILVTFEAAYRNDVGGKFLVTKVLDVIANLVSELSQTTREPIMDVVCCYSVAPGWVTMSGR